jgi:hypothetical protein
MGMQLGQGFRYSASIRFTDQGDCTKLQRLNHLFRKNSAVLGVTNKVAVKVG